MKTFKITTIFKVTDEYYNDEVLELKNDILTSQYQKMFKSDKKKGLITVKATFEDLK